MDKKLKPDFSGKGGGVKGRKQFNDLLKVNDMILLIIFIICISIAGVIRYSENS